MRINQNIAAFNAFRNLSATNNLQAKSLEKLSSGFRINRAADDAAGLSISEGLRSQIGGLKTAVRNAQDGVSVVQTAEGGLSEVHAILQRMRDLAVQAANGGSQDADARQAAQTEIDQLASEIDRIANTTKFGGSNLLDGTYGTRAATSGTVDASAGSFTATGATDTFTIQVGSTTTAAITIQDAADPDEMQNELSTSVRSALSTAGLATDAVSVSVTDADGDGYWTVEFSSDAAFTLGDSEAGSLATIGVSTGAVAASGTGGVFQVGANNSAADRISVSVSSVAAAQLGTGVDGLSVTTTSGAQAAITSIDSAIKEVSTTRANLGAYQNRFEHTIANLQVTQENLAASESRIRDTDMAAEMVSFTRHQILSQAGTAMLAQANQMPQSVLSLLR